MNTQPNNKRLTRQRNLATLVALLLAATSATASVATAASTTTYVCVSKTTSQIYFKAKCGKTERRVPFTSATNGTNGIDGAKGESAYETWLKAGNLGTPADFLRSLKGTDGSVGPAGASPSLPFYQRLESGLTCDEKWRTVTTSVYSNNQAGVDRQQALAGCAQPDWAKQYFQFPDTNRFTLVSATFGTPALTIQKTRVNNVLVDNPYAPKLITVSFSAVVEAHPPAGWALCTNADPQITFTNGSGYPKIGWDDVNGTTFFSVTGNRATVTGSFSTTDAASLSAAEQPLYLTAQICGPDTSTPSGLGIRVLSQDLILPAVNP